MCTCFPVAVSSRRKGRNLAALLLSGALLLMLGLLPSPAVAAPASATGPQIPRFYTVSARDAAPFYHHDYSAPSNTRAFPHQVAYVYYYSASL